jgi:hypothetical protein
MKTKKMDIQKIREEKKPTNGKIRVRVPFAEAPDQTWPGRAREINSLLVATIDVLQESKPLLKEDVATRQLVKAVHFFTLQAAAFLNLADQKTLWAVLQKNQKGTLFKHFMKAA